MDARPTRDSMSCLECVIWPGREMVRPITKVQDHRIQEKSILNRLVVGMVLKVKLKSCEDPQISYFVETVTFDS